MDIELDFENWCNGLINVLKEMMNPDDSIEIEKKDVVTHKYDLITGVKSGEINDKYEYDSRVKNYVNSIEFKIVKNYELCENGCTKSIHHIELTSKDMPDYKTGDIIYLYPENSDENVKKLVELLKYDFHYIISLKPKELSTGLLFPNSLTLYYVLKRYYDITTPLRPNIIRSLIPYIKDVDEKDELKGICADQSMFKTEFSLKKINIIDFIQLYPSLNIPLLDFLEIMPLITPRAYTISNHNLTTSSCLNLTVGLLEEKLDRRVVYGFCSNYLINAELGLQIHGYIHNNNLNLLRTLNSPIILINAGTGMSLLRCVLQERSYYKKILQKTPGNCYVFYGCRKENEDFIYHDELKEYEREKIITKLNCAFSRETNKKIYVQHLVSKNSKIIWDVLSKNGCIILCGSISMGNDVYKELLEIAKIEGMMGEIPAEKYLQKLKDEKRYITEVWST